MFMGITMQFVKAQKAKLILCLNLRLSHFMPLSLLRCEGLVQLQQVDLRIDQSILGRLCR